MFREKGRWGNGKILKIVAKILITDASAKPIPKKLDKPTGDKHSQAHHSHQLNC